MPPPPAFPLTAHGTKAACTAAVRAARHGMALLDEQRVRTGLPPLPFAEHCISAP